MLPWLQRAVSLRHGLRRPMPSISSIFVKRSPDRHGVSCLILRQRPCRLYRWKESLVWLLRGQGWALWSTLIRPVGCSTISLHYVRSCKPQLKAHLRLHVQMQEMCTLTHTQIPPRKAASPNASCSFAVASSAANRFPSMKRDLFEQCAYVYLH